MKKITEQDSNFDHIDKMSTEALLTAMNSEDRSVPLAVEQSIRQIVPLVDEVHKRLEKGGRLFYIGAGTSGRLGVLDASECPPTYGVPPELVTGVIAGGHIALVRSVESAEDSLSQAWLDLEKEGIEQGDALIGIAASGTTPYVIGALREANAKGLLTGCITCNPNSPVAAESQYPIEVIVGPEFVTGSTRMKAGTAQKLVLNMISTSLMVKLGRVQGNKMVDMQINNSKLKERAVNMIINKLGVGSQRAKELLEEFGSVRRATESYKK